MTNNTSASAGTFRQPPAFSMIFILEFWERFGYYGMQAVLATFFIKAFGMADAESFTIFGAFSAMVYGYVAVGGFIGDKVLGTQRTMLLGALCMMAGYFILGFSTVDKSLVYIALAIIAVGNGLFKANPSSLLSKLYSKDDPRLDGAFTLYYMAVNIGSFISSIVIPYIGGTYGLTYGFYICGVGLICSVVVFMIGRKRIQGIDSSVGLQPLKLNKLLIVLVGVIIVAILSAWMLKNVSVARWLLLIVGVTVFAIFFREIFKSSGLERGRMIAAVLFMVQGVVFFTLYQQVPTSLNFFAIRNVEHEILGITVKNAESFQSLNAFWVMALSPVFAWIYAYFGRKGKDLSLPGKFALGQVFCAAAFLIIPLGANFASAQGFVSAWWLVGAYLFQSAGELLISGLGLAMVAKLVPQRMVGFLMGAWFLCISASGVIGGWVASFTAMPKGVIDPLQSLPVYAKVFLNIGCLTAIFAVVAILLVPLLKRLTGHSGAEEIKPSCNS